MKDEDDKKIDLVEKYDIALSHIFGVEKVDLIAECKTEREVRNLMASAKLY